MNPSLLTAGLLVWSSTVGITETADTLYQGGAILTMVGKEPTKVDPMAIKDIKVKATIKEGQWVYRAE